MKKKILLFVTSLLTLIYSCNNNSAESNAPPKKPQTYKEAKKYIELSIYKIEETISTSKSSWIRGATYYSEDGIRGYMILKTDSKDYIYSDLPFEIWQGFKNAQSFGSYYHQNIKGKYQFKLN